MSLRRIVKEATGQDVYLCHACFDCDVEIQDEMDVPLCSLIQLVLYDDEEALQTRTLWSDSVLAASRGACKRGLDLHAVMLALRAESKRRTA
ncbi:MAG TPA: hypothetical protein VIN60_05455 [Anaerolineales bacterium]